MQDISEESLSPWKYHLVLKLLIFPVINNRIKRAIFQIYFKSFFVLFLGNSGYIRPEKGLL